MDELEKLKNLYSRWAGKATVSCERLPGAGSERKYFRLVGENGVSAIGTVGESADENRVFIAMASHLRAKGIRVPEIYAVSEDFSVYLQEDLGDMSLFGFLSHGRASGKYGAEEAGLLENSIRRLPAIAVKGAEGFDFARDCLYPGFGRRTVFYDLNYFKYCFLKLKNMVFDENRLEDDFEALAGQLLAADGKYFMYRDFQARNVMLKDGCSYFIDFQGARPGPLEYDVASFVWQSKAGYGEELRKRLVDAYIEELGKLIPADRMVFIARLRVFVFFRMLQVLGAYGYRGLYERNGYKSAAQVVKTSSPCFRKHFSAMIPGSSGRFRAAIWKGLYLIFAACCIPSGIQAPFWKWKYTVFHIKKAFRRTAAGTAEGTCSIAGAY